MADSMLRVGIVGGTGAWRYTEPYVHWVPDGQPYILTRTRLFQHPTYVA